MADRESPPRSQPVDAEAVSELEAVPLHSTDLLTLLDPTGTIQYESPAIERLYGYDQNELVGEQVADYFHPDDRQRVMDAFEAVITGEAHHTESVEYRHLMADGSYRWIESVGSANPTPEGNYVINSRDISDRKQREAQLREAREQLQTEHDAKEAIRRLLFERSTGRTLAESVCRLLVEEYDYSGAWVVQHYADVADSEPRYHLIASAGDESFRRGGSTTDSQSPVDPATQTVCETVEAVAVDANASDNDTLVDHLADCGLQAVRAVPIEHDGVSDGVLTVVRERDEPTLGSELLEEFLPEGFRENII